MINDLENNTYVNNGMSELEFDKNSVEMMRYRQNKFSYSFGFGGLACSVAAAIFALNSLNPGSVAVIIKILMNIFILLFGFLLNEKVKAYSAKASIGMMCLGGACAARIFWIPLQLIIAEAKGPSDPLYTKWLGATITSKTTLNRVNWIWQSGVVRGIIIIALLVGAAACFIIAGFVGYKRSVKLNTYLDSIKDIKK